MKDRETARKRKYGESKTTGIMMATVPHVTSGLGLKKFQADGFLLTRVYTYVCGERMVSLQQYLPTFSMVELLKYFSMYRGIPTYVDENKTERQSVAHGDYSSSANCRTKIPTTLRDIWNLSRYVINFIYLLHYSSRSSWRCLRNPGCERLVCSNSAKIDGLTWYLKYLET